MNTIRRDEREESSFDLTTKMIFTGYIQKEDIYTQHERIDHNLRNNNNKSNNSNSSLYACVSNIHSGAHVYSMYAE